MKIMFFSLNAAIWSHSLPESRLARELIKHGNEIAYVTCGEAFPVHCTSMDAFGVATDASVKAKKKICRLCIKNASVINASANYHHIQLSSFVNSADHNFTDNLIHSVTQENYLEFKYLGVPVGRIATYEPYLKHKKMSTKLSEVQWSDYCVQLKNCIISLIGFSRIYETQNPDKVFIYSPQYGTNGVCAEYAINLGSSVYFVEGSSSNAERYSALRVWDWAQYRLVNPALQNWVQMKERISVEDVLRVKSHIEELYEGRSFAVFSEPKRGGFVLRDYFSIPNSSKIILATLSSFDEAYSASIIGGFPERKVKSTVFKDQFEWIEKTISFLKDKPNFFLIIRVHPRDFPNKREGTKSEQAETWRGILSNLPPNVVLNSPEQKISIYDFLEQIDLVLTGWSATGIEALLHGVSVVTYDKFLPSYPPDIHFSGLTEAEYYKNIEIALFSENRLTNILGSYRWLAVNFSVGTIRITPSIELGKRWSRHILFRLIKRFINKIFQFPIRWLDVRRGFGNEIDRKRFVSFVKENKSSLYGVVLTPPESYIDNIQLKQLVSNADSAAKIQVK